MTDNPQDLLKAAAHLDRKELLILLTSSLNEIDVLVKENRLHRRFREKINQLVNNNEFKEN